MTFLTETLSLPGLSAKHTWRGGMVVFGDNQGTLPRYKLTNIKGLWSTPDIEDNRRRLFGRMGEQSTPGAMGGKTVTYSGIVQANAMEELEYYCNLLEHASYTDQQLSEGVMSIARVKPGGHTYQFTARLVQVEVDDEQTAGAMDRPSPWQRPFVVAFRLGDPRVYVTDAQVQVTSPAGAGNNNPFIDVANPGAYDGVPVLRVYGPTGSFIVSRPGAALRVNLALGGAEWADIDFASRKITRSDGTDHTLDRDIGGSSWWDAGQEGIPGQAGSVVTTRITLSTVVGNPGIGAKVRVTFLPAV